MNLAMGPFFDSAIHSLLHLPETLEKKISLPPSARRHDSSRDRRAADDHEEERSLESVPVDILETAKEYTFIIDVPGLSKANVQVTLEEDDKLLVIRGGGKRRRDEEEEVCRYLRLERRVPTKFCRRFRMPEDSNSAAISAKCENGVLTVVVGKVPPPEPKKKSVRVSVA